MMTKRTNRTAWGMAVVLAAVVLIGARWAVFGPPPVWEYYSLGVECGARDATIGENLGPALRNPGAALIYVGYRMEFYVDNGPEQQRRRAVRLYDRVVNASEAGKRRYMAAFAKGYWVGQRLQRVWP
jgi:hypothetical protein